MPNPTVGSEVDAFYPQIRRRLIESGEWDRWANILNQQTFVAHNGRIRTALYNKLNECGWADSVKDECKGWLAFTLQIFLNANVSVERMRSSPDLSAKDLLQDLAANSHREYILE